MTAHIVGRLLRLRWERVLLGALVVGCAASGCFSAGAGSAPPASSFYYPVGLAVSRGGNVLYAVNSDFDLQWNGGTLQSYDLFKIRQHTAELIYANLHGQWIDLAKSGKTTSTPDPTIPFLYEPITTPDAASGTPENHCSNLPSDPASRPSGQRVPPGQQCAPPVDSTQSVYFKDAAVIGAFASDFQLANSAVRLFSPVRGDATLTWADVTPDNVKEKPQGDSTTLGGSTVASYAPFAIQCTSNGGGVGRRCDADHHAGNNPNAAGDTRQITMPGEPYGMAQSQDGTAIAVTQQASAETSLLLSGFGKEQPVLNPPTCSHGGVCPPTMQFVVEMMPLGGNGLAAVPHDPDAVVRCEDNGDLYPCVRQAFLETSRSVAEVHLLRYYDDDGSSLHRPFLQDERAYPIIVNSFGSDSRGIAIDPTPRLVCRAKKTPLNGTIAKADAIQCGQIPARVFIANRSPPSLLYGELGGFSSVNGGTYDPDLLTLKASVPIVAGPSRVYLAPIVDPSGHYAIRVFVVCYDSAVVYVFDPDRVQYDLQLAEQETLLHVGPGPYAMAFDPFCNGLVDAQGKPLTDPISCASEPFAEVAASQAHAAENMFLVPNDTRQDSRLLLKNYRFGYLTSFTQSFVQVMDLDDSLPTQETFEQIVFTLGQPTPPKGT